jgi:hypothetical protein
MENFNDGTGHLPMVMEHLYPDLNKTTNSHTGKVEQTADLSLLDFYLEDNSDGNGPHIVWQNSDIPEPTEQELSDAREPAVNATWWAELRLLRDKFLTESDWSQGTDVPTDLKASYETYRQELRDLPNNVTKPSYEVLKTQRAKLWEIYKLMPTKPEDN